MANTHLSPLHAIHDTLNAYQHILHNLGVRYVLLEYHLHLGQDHAAYGELSDAIEYVAHSHHSCTLCNRNCCLAGGREAGRELAKIYNITNWGNSCSI